MGLFISYLISKSYFSKIRIGRNFSRIPNVIQNGRIKPSKKKSIQNAKPPIIKNNTIPKMLIAQ